MEEEVIEKTSKGSPILVSVGILGLLLGIIAIALSLSAMVKVGNTAQSMNDKIEKAAALALDLKKMGDKIDAINAQFDNLKNGYSDRVDNLTNQTKAAIEKISSILIEDRKLIEENRVAMEKIAKGRIVKQRAEAPSQPTAQGASASEAPSKDASEQTKADSENGEFIVYKIQGGDTIAKIAPKYKTTIEAIIAANPKLNPSRLRIGQAINIPKK